MTWHLPAPEPEYLLAIGLIAEPGQTQLRVLHAFMGQPKTPTEIPTALRGRHNNRLESALVALRRAGLITSRHRLDGWTPVYQLTSLH